MDIQVITADQISDIQAAAWSKLQSQDPSLQSPFFRPEFTKAVAEARKGVRIVLLNDSGIKTIGFLPFQMEKGSKGRPVGWPLSDFQGIIARKDIFHDPADIIHQTELKSWHFDHLILSQPAFRPYHMKLDPSPFIDLSEGFEAYRKDRLLSGSSLIGQVERKSRKLIREQGPIRLDFNTRSPGIFSHLLEWKGQQLNKRYLPDIYKIPWIRSLLESILEQQNRAFRGRLSALYAGETLIAAHFGIQSNDNLSSLIPTFNPDYKKYSPGLLLHYLLAKSSDKEGIRRIDLGRGLNQLKLRMMTNALPLAIGVVELRPLHRRLKTYGLKCRSAINSSPRLKQSLLYLKRIGRPALND